MLGVHTDLAGEDVIAFVVCTQDGIGEFFWMHDWGSGGRIHPRTTIHQLPQSQQRVIDGVTVDINHVYATDWGQWIPHVPHVPVPPAPPATPEVPAPSTAQLTQLPNLLRTASSL